MNLRQMESWSKVLYVKKCTLVNSAEAFNFLKWKKLAKCSIEIFPVSVLQKEAQAEETKTQWSVLSSKTGHVITAIPLDFKCIFHNPSSTVNGWKKLNADQRACKQHSAELWTGGLHVFLQTELSIIWVISICLKAYRHVFFSRHDTSSQY